MDGRCASVDAAPGEDCIVKAEESMLVVLHLTDDC